MPGKLSVVFSATTAYFSLSEEVKCQALKDTAFADGLRGIAALFVLASHLVLCYARNLVNACCAPNSSSPSFFQLPILRLVTAGHSWVAVFFVLLGFVNALKPIKLARGGQSELAAANLANGAFGRICRLVLPATAATVVSWTLCQMGFYENAQESDAFWLHTTTPQRSSSSGAAILDLFKAIKGTWTLGEGNPYDQPQWAMLYLLQGSMMVVTGLLVTVNMTSLWRIIAMLAFSLWSIDWTRQLRDPFVGLCCFSGVLLAELSLSTFPARISTYSHLVAPPLTLLSLMLMSYTNHNQEGRPWSAALHAFGSQYLPKDGEGGLDRIYGTIGGSLLVISIIFSPHARLMLSQKALKWIGKVSFAIYLLHGTMLRTVFAWTLSVGQAKKEFVETVNDGLTISAERYPVPGAFQCVVATIVCVLAVLVVSCMWSNKVEPALARTTKHLQHLATGRDSRVSRVTAEEMHEKSSEGGVLLLPLAKWRTRSLA